MTKSELIERLVQKCHAVAAKDVENAVKRFWIKCHSH